MAGNLAGESGEGFAESDEGDGQSQGGPAVCHGDGVDVECSQAGDALAEQ
ncbi:hypothetical protein GCM10027280_33600 [Micromonospora polyrhachis]